MYPSSVLKLAWNIHPSDSILQGYVLNKDCKQRKKTNISSPNCISAFISNKGTSEELSQT